MSKLPVSEEALFRAVTAYQHKVLAYYLDLRDGAINSRTLNPDEIQEPPPGPSVKPLPLLGGDLSTKKDESPFGPPPTTVEKGGLAGLFGDEGPKKKAFDGDFWKREGGSKPDPFGGSGYRRQSSSKKLAELFGGEQTKEHSPVPSKPKPVADPALQAVPELDLNEPLQRIPPASFALHVEWMKIFANECGDSKIQEVLLKAIASSKKDPQAAFERALLNYQRLGQQWDVYYRKQARHYAEAWLRTLPILWEIVN